MWESVTNAIKHNANWVKAVVRQEEQKAESERQEAIGACRKLVKEAKQRFRAVRETLGFPDLEWEHFISSYAQKQFEDPLFPHVLEQAPLKVLRDRCGIWESIKGALSATRPLAWVEEIAQQHNKTDVQPNIGQEISGEAVGFSDTDTIKLTGLRSVLERLHADGALEEQVGDGTRHANLYETTPEKVLALRDLILAESKQEQEPSSELQIQPLGPSDAIPKAEVNTSDATVSKPFAELDMDCKVNVRFAIDKVGVLTKIEDLPNTIITLSEELYKALTDYAPDYSADAGDE